MPLRERTAYAAAFTGSPFSTRSPSRTLKRTVSPSLMRPARICSASGSCTWRWITRFKRTRAVGRVVAAVGEPRARLVVELERDLAIGQQLLQALDLDVDDLAHLRALQAMEQDDVVEAVQELGPELGAAPRP